jgi:ATP-dependent exoDNAse (exonuclease V) beta subunit
VLTRAVDQLYIISKKDISSKGVINDKTYAGMLISYLKHIEKWSDNQLSYSFGELTHNNRSNKKEETHEPLLSISTAKEDHNLSIITRAGLLWNTKQEKAIERGNLVHHILSKIKNLEDVDVAFNHLLFSGVVTTENLKELQSLVVNVIEHPKLNPYFQDGFKIYNERDIITNSGQLLRPDRLNINSKNEVVIIDYKTGDEKNQHKSQLNAYEFVLNQMNLKVTSKLIVYINDTIDVIEV